MPQHVGYCVFGHSSNKLDCASNPIVLALGFRYEVMAERLRFVQY